MRFQFADELHGAYLGCTAQSTCREGVDECFDRAGIFVQRTADAAYQVDNMTVILHFLVEIYFYIVAVAGKIVTGEIDQHDMFRILFGIIMQILGVQRILFGISGTLGSAGDGVDIGVAAFDTAVRLG